MTLTVMLLSGKLQVLNELFHDIRTLLAWEAIPFQPPPNFFPSAMDIVILHSLH
jgi:hypothetical protein